MSEILRLIANSPSDLGRVLQSVAEQAAHICQAQFVDIFRVENDDLRNVAGFGEIKRTLAFPLDRSSVAGRSICDMRPVSIDDLQNAGDDFARGREIARKDGGRSILAVPLIQQGQALGTILIRRTEIKPFEQKHIALLANFAAQAVIAIENARLLNELRESLQQQTASADVLRIISSSPGELDPVFSAILKNAVSLCEATLGNLFLYNGEDFVSAAVYASSPNYAASRRPGLVIRHLHPEVPLNRMTRTKELIHIADVRTEQAYIDRDPVFCELVDGGGARTLLVVPLVKEGTLVGAMAVYRQEVRPFTDTQVALVRNFASQAVIAIENARLLNELRESLEQQTATADVLRIISSSPGDLKPVFATILDKALHLCEAAFGFVTTYDGEGFERAAQ